MGCVAAHSNEGGFMETQIKGFLVIESQSDVEELIKKIFNSG